ncbi:MAG: TIGR04282 family arsenosugar biosynthesis glycosyltransferase [Luteibaculum sp.]
MRRALIIFAKNPEKGKVKTRLAKDLGSNEALTWYLRLLKRTETAIQGLTAEKTVYWSKAEPLHPPAFYRDEFAHKVQQGENLGDKMSQAIEDQFRKGYDALVIIGTDCWDLKPKHIEEAYQLLRKNDVVMGPAKDGGYYLLGMNRYHPELFENVPWSTEEVANVTRKACQKLELSMAEIETLNDVDKVHDLPLI